MSKLNYYQILGVAEDASIQEIKDAYRDMIKAFHPDYYRGSNKDFAEKKTKELNEAYEILKNPESKAKYDQFLHNEKASREKEYPNSHESQQQTRSSDNQDATKEKHPKKKSHVKKEIAKLPTKTVIKLIIGVVLCVAFLLIAYNQFVGIGRLKYSGTYTYYASCSYDPDSDTYSELFDAGIKAVISLNSDSTCEIKIGKVTYTGLWEINEELKIIFSRLSETNDLIKVISSDTVYSDGSLLTFEEDNGKTYAHQFLKS